MQINRDGFATAGGEARPAKLHITYPDSGGDILGSWTLTMWQEHHGVGQPRETIVFIDDECALVGTAILSMATAGTGESLWECVYLGVGALKLIGVDTLLEIE